MTPSQASLLISLNAILVILVAAVAYYQAKSYNTLVKRGANHIPAPTRVIDTVEIDIPLPEVRFQCAIWRQAGYQVVRSKGSHRGQLTLVMTKTLDGTNTIR